MDRYLEWAISVTYETLRSLWIVFKKVRNVEDFTKDFLFYGLNTSSMV